MAGATKQSVKTSGDFCGAINCVNARYKPECKGMSFFRFPPDEERKWIQNSRREDHIGRSAKELSSKGCKLCSVHFEPSQFNRPSDRDRLVWNAVPTLFDIANPPAKVTPKRKPPNYYRSNGDPPSKKRRVQENELSQLPVPVEDDSQDLQLTQCATGLTVPSDELVKALHVMESAFLKNVCPSMHAAKVRARLVRQLTKVLDTDVLVCSVATCGLKRQSCEGVLQHQTALLSEKKTVNILIRNL